MQWVAPINNSTKFCHCIFRRVASQVSISYPRPCWYTFCVVWVYKAVSIENFVLECLCNRNSY